MNTQPYKEWIEGIFDRSAELYDQKYNTFLNHFAKELIALAALPPPAHILDIATGRGAILKEAATAIGVKGKAVGIDISSGELEYIYPSFKVWFNSLWAGVPRAKLEKCTLI